MVTAKIEPSVDAATRFLVPNVYWAQNAHQVTLKVDLKDAKNWRMQYTENALHFEASGTGATGGGRQLYQFTLLFYAGIDGVNMQLRAYDNRVELCVPKSQAGWWPRLVSTPQKPHWLKIDFDRWCTEDELIEAAERQPRDVRDDYPNEYRRLQKRELGYVREQFRQAYLVVYNISQLCGFLYILSVLGLLYYRDGSASQAHAYAHVGVALKFCQLLQLLELLHPLFGYTKGSVLSAALQVLGRNFVLFVMIEAEPRMQTKPVVFYLIVVWSLVELYRYPYYLFQLVGWPNGFVTWLRYTVWIPLYPLGLFLEGVIILRNIPYFEETQRYSVSLPNSLNFSFDMSLFLRLYLALFIIPGGCYLMSQMARAREQKLKSV